MTNFPSFLTTVGLNVPADSNPSPWGAMIGLSEPLSQLPNGTLMGGVVAVATITNTAQQSIRSAVRTPIFDIEIRPSFYVQICEHRIPSGMRKRYRTLEIGDQ